MISFPYWVNVYLKSIYKMNKNMLNIQSRSYGFQPETTYLIFILIKDEFYPMLQLFFRIYKTKFNFLVSRQVWDRSVRCETAVWDFPRLFNTTKYDGVGESIKNLFCYTDFILAYFDRSTSCMLPSWLALFVTHGRINRI